MPAKKENDVSKSLFLFLCLFAVSSLNAANYSYSKADGGFNEYYGNVFNDNPHPEERNPAIAEDQEYAEQISAVDRQLMDRIRAALEGSGTVNAYNNVKVNVDHRLVVLSGTVDSEKVRTEIKNKIGNVKGITGIDDQLEISEKK
jgi:hypothetical protein